MRNQWGLLRDDKANPQAVENREQFTTRELDRANRFLRLINHSSPEREDLSTRLLHIVGKGRPTLAKVILLKDRGEAGGLLLFDGKDLRKIYPRFQLTFFLKTVTEA